MTRRTVPFAAELAPRRREGLPLARRVSGYGLTAASASWALDRAERPRDRSVPPLGDIPASLDLRLDLCVSGRG